jgi:hypothetical protein
VILIKNIPWPASKRRALSIRIHNVYFQLPLMVAVCKEVATLLKHKNAKRGCYFARHYSLDRGAIPLKGLHKALNKHILPANATLPTGRPVKDKGCVGFGLRHGAAVDKAVCKWADDGKLPRKCDPCAKTAVKALQAAGISPVLSQLIVYDEGARTGTAVDLLCTEVVDGERRALLVELKSTMHGDQWFKKKGQLRELELPYSCTTAALLQAEVPCVWLERWGLKRPASCVLIVGPKGFSRIVRSTAKMKRAAVRVADLIN